MQVFFSEFFKKLLRDFFVLKIVLSVMLPYFPKYPAGISHSHNTAGNILGNDTTGTDDRIVTDDGITTSRL